MNGHNEDAARDSPSGRREKDRQPDGVSANTPAYRTPEHVLKSVFGYASFRPLQREIIGSLLTGRDTVAVLPTGAGKSLCYQIPALVTPGLTLVISPLIALMKDQVDQLVAAGVAATYLNSSLAAPESRSRMNGLDRGEYKLLYAAPERLTLDSSVERLKGWGVSAIAVDEAHCISEWGHDFRPEYRKIGALRRKLGAIPVAALTATATPQVRDDIIAQLALKTPAVFVAGFNRPNLSYSVIPKSSVIGQVIEFVASRPHESGIVYCQARKTTESVAEALARAGHATAAYHAGLASGDRSEIQERFLRDEIRTVCATIAFGMGIDKPNVRYVLHADLPKNIEGYYQETGRAGRDGLPADCVLLYSRSDAVKLLRFIDDIEDEATRAVARRQLKKMADLAETTGCRRIGLLGYFGETWTEENCGACDNCLDPPEIEDVTIPAQKLLSCILRIERHGFRTGLNHAVDILTGSRAEKILKWGHDRLPTHGIGADKTKGFWVDLGRRLLASGLIEIDPGRFSTVGLTPSGLEKLVKREAILLAKPRSSAGTPEGTSHGRRRMPRAGEILCDEGLFDALRRLRKELADARDVPPYVIFSDVTLRLMARSYPTTEAEMLSVPGVGERKLAAFGGAFLAVIAGWLATNSKVKFPPVSVGAATSSGSSQTRLPLTNAASKSVLETARLFADGCPIDEIARVRDLSQSTIGGHLAKAVQDGVLDDPRAFYSLVEETEMKTAFDPGSELHLKPVFERLKGLYPYWKLRIYREFRLRRGQ